MPSKVRKSPIKTGDAIANVERALAHYETSEEPFNIKELCERANVSYSWLYRKGDPVVEALADRARLLAKGSGGSGRHRRLQDVPPEPIAREWIDGADRARLLAKESGGSGQAVPPEPIDRDAIAREWIDGQIQYYGEAVAALRQRQEQIKLELELNEKQVGNLIDRLEHLHKVRELSQKELD